MVWVKPFTLLFLPRQPAGRHDEPSTNDYGYHLTMISVHVLCSIVLTFHDTLGSVGRELAASLSRAPRLFCLAHKEDHDEELPLFSYSDRIALLHLGNGRRTCWVHSIYRSDVR